MKYHIGERMLIGVDIAPGSYIIIPTIWVKKSLAFIGINVMVLNIRFHISYQRKLL